MYRLTTSFRHSALDAAAELVARHGLGKTTMQDVADTAGCSRAGLYRHFPTKDALLRALALREVEHFLEAHRNRVEGLEGPQRVEEAFVFAVRYVREHPVVRGILAVEPETLVGAVARGEVGAGLVRTTAALVAQLIEQGNLRPVDPEVVARTLLRLLLSYVLAPELGEEPSDEDALRETFREVVLDGLAPR